MHIIMEKRVSHRKWRALVKATRRKRKRRTLAITLQIEEEKFLAELMSDTSYCAHIEEQKLLEEEAQRLEEIASRRRRDEWIERDLTLHSEWLKNKGKERLILEQQHRKEDLLKKEWQDSVRKEEEEISKKKEQQREHYDSSALLSLSLQEALLLDVTSKLGTESTSNPDPPQGYSRVYKEKEVEPCPFFNKTGTCRFGADCSREHKYPSESRTILLPNMYTHFGLNGEFTDDYDMDLSLEYTESDRYTHFREFYYDVLPEFEKCGRVIQIKVCNNRSAHLRGNVYVQYRDVEAAQTALRKFNGRWYAGKQISCIFIPIERWKSAICGLYWFRKCPKGDMCNFLHVFKNPGNAFYEADRDLHLTKDAARNHREEQKEKRSSSREEKSESRRHRTRSRSKSDCSRNRRYTRDRSRSRRDYSRSSRSRNYSSEREKSRSSRKRSRDRSRKTSGSSSSERNKENKKKRSKVRKSDQERDI